jgi:7-cyano-7-deazaguanine synthase in queuosine biosynthesis
MRFLRYTGRPRPQDLKYKAALEDESTVILDSWSREQANTAWSFRLNGRLASVRVHPRTQDLFDIATMVYVADEIVPRMPVADRWTRTIDLAVPVAEPQMWDAAKGVLSECVSFLSGDSWRFEWFERARTVPKRTIHRHQLRSTYDDVCLFSGGVDSLLGAANLLAQRRKVLLVGHHADRVTSTAQRDLFGMLQRKHPGRADLLQVHVERSRAQHPRFRLPAKVEITHRPRSFLFLVAGTLAASAAKTPSLWIPENGLIALNVPLSPSRRGTLSTRTTHPRFLEYFNGVMAALEFDVRVDNPFWSLSKTDMVAAVDDPELRDALGRSVSCAHSGNLWREEEGRYRQCGYCVPCLYRRIAFLEASIPEPDYQHDVFVELPRLSAKKSRDVRALVSFARRVVDAPDIQLMSMVLQHGSFGGGPAAEGHAVRCAMIRRWASGFIRIARSQASPGVRRILAL